MFEFDRNRHKSLFKKEYFKFKITYVALVGDIVNVFFIKKRGCLNRLLSILDTNRPKNPSKIRFFLDKMQVTKSYKALFGCFEDF